MRRFCHCALSVLFVIFLAMGGVSISFIHVGAASALDSRTTQLSASDSLAGVSSLSSEDMSEVRRGIDSLLVPEAIQSDYAQPVTFAQYCEMLQRLIAIWKPDLLSSWSSIAAEASGSDANMCREDGLVALSHALVLLGVTDPNLYSTVNQDLPESEIDASEQEFTWSCPLFDTPDEVVYPWCQGNYIHGGLMTCIHLASPRSMKTVLEYDRAAHSMRFREPFTRLAAIQSVVRLAEIDPAILEPDGDYVSADQAGTYDRTLITDAMLDQASSLPEPTQAALPSSWRGAGLSTNKDGRSTYRHYSLADIRFLSDNGFNFMRLFLGFDTLRFPDYPQNAMFVNRHELLELDQLLAWAIQYDIHLQISMINVPSRDAQIEWHGDTYPTDQEWDLMAAYWGMLAKRYAGIPNRYLSFDICNELCPDANRFSNAVKKIQNVISEIRQSDMTRVLLYSYPGSASLKWVGAMAKLGLAIGCHPYYPSYITTGDWEYAIENPYATPQWPLVWLPMGKVSTGAPLTITGAIGGCELSLHIRSPRAKASVTVAADGKKIAVLKAEGIEKSGSMYVYNEKLLSTTLPADAKQIKLRVSGGAYIDTIIVKGSFGEVHIVPHDNKGIYDMSAPLPLVIRSDGTYTNSENRMVTQDDIYVNAILPIQKIADRYGVGMMVNEFGIFGTDVFWDIDTVVAYHESMLHLLTEKNIGWCYCELYNTFGKHIVLLNGTSQWKGTAVDTVTYQEGDLTETLSVNRQLLDVFRKYTLVNKP